MLGFYVASPRVDVDSVFLEVDLRRLNRKPAEPRAEERRGRDGTSPRRRFVDVPLCRDAIERMRRKGLDTFDPVVLA